MRHPALLALVALLGLAGCGDGSAPDYEAEKPVRGLLTTTVGEAEATTRRRYPGVLEPKDIVSLSFEVAGKLGEVNLSVGQRIAKGTTLAALDSEQFEISIENRKAARDEAEATLARKSDDLARQRKLLQSGTVTRVSVDQAETDFKTARARFRQADEALKSAEEDLENSVLTAPFDGIVNSVDADSFATVGVGAPILSLYDTSAYEVSFSVNFDTVSELLVGTPAVVRLADDPSVGLAATISELGERADTVSSFPVIVELQEDHPLIRAGMAVEVAFEFRLPANAGFLIPITAAIADGELPETAGPRAASPVAVYVYDPETSTVKRREAVMAGIRDNKLLVIEGLEPGERVAVAGVTYLRDGMKVKLIETEG